MEQRWHKNRIRRFVRGGKKHSLLGGLLNFLRIELDHYI